MLWVALACQDPPKAAPDPVSTEFSASNGPRSAPRFGPAAVRCCTWRPSDRTSACGGDTASGARFGLDDVCIQPRRPAGLGRFAEQVVVAFESGQVCRRNKNAPAKAVAAEKNIVETDTIIRT